MSMHTWFECKIRHEKTMENGMIQKVTESYLVDALSFTEAEARIIEEVTPFITGEFTVSDIKRANYSELFVSDEEAKTLMRDCSAFLFPSFYEGFGIPPLEAISAGAKQVVVSDTEVMHEIFGDGVIYVDPNNYNIELLDFPEISNTQISELLKKYSWKKSAETLLELLQNMDQGLDK